MELRDLLPFSFLDPRNDNPVAQGIRDLEYGIKLALGEELRQRLRDPGQPTPYLPAELPTDPGQVPAHQQEQNNPYLPQEFLQMPNSRQQGGIASLGVANNPEFDNTDWGNVGHNITRLASGGAAYGALKTAGDAIDAVGIYQQWSAGKLSTKQALAFGGLAALPFLSYPAIRALPDETLRRMFGGKASPPGSEQAQQGMARLYHGTPNRFRPEPGFSEGRPRFSAAPSRLADGTTIPATRHTGEGATAFGEGHYANTGPETASAYKTTGAPRLMVGGQILDDDALPVLAERLGIDDVQHVRDIRTMVNNGQSLPEIRQDAERAIGFSEGLRSPAGARHAESLRGRLDAIDKLGEVERSPGNLYAYDWYGQPGTPRGTEMDTLLDLDAPLSEQPEAVRRVMADLGVYDPSGNSREMQAWRSLFSSPEVQASQPDYVRTILESAGDWDLLPENKQRLFAKLLHKEGVQLPPDVSEATGVGRMRIPTGSDAIEELDSYTDASQTLYDAGIPGSKFLDAGSRDAGEGTQNVVLFRPQDDVVENVQRLGPDLQPLGAVIGGGKQRGAVGRDISAEKFRFDPDLDDSGRPIQVPVGQNFSAVKPSGLASRLEAADLDNPLLIDYEAWKNSPAGKEVGQRLKAGMGEMGGLRINKRRSPQGAVDEAVDQLASNVDFLFNAAPQSLVDDAGEWYVGAQGIARKGAELGNRNLYQTASSTSAFSPSTDWNDNVEQAQRLWYMLRDPSMRDFRFSDDMAQVVKNHPTHMYDGNPVRKSTLRNIEGRTLGEVLEKGDAAEVAMFTSILDKAHFPAERPIRAPTGVATDQMQKYKVNSLAAQANSVKAYMGEDLPAAARSLRAELAENSHLPPGAAGAANISELMASDALGNANKARSFGADILNPESRSITGDTHAVSGAHLQPYGSSDPLVNMAFGNAGMKQSAPGFKPFMSGAGMSWRGHEGTYPLYNEAYQRTGDQLLESGRIPRMTATQSVTWEYARDMMKGKKGAPYKAVVGDIWTKYQAGKMTQAQAQEATAAIFQADRKDVLRWAKALKPGKAINLSWLAPLFVASGAATGITALAIDREEAR